MEPQEIHELLVAVLTWQHDLADNEADYLAIGAIIAELNQIMGEHHDGPSEARAAYQRVLRCCQHRIRTELGE